MTNTIQVLILMGPPGCGKGTQGDRIAQDLGVPKISTGELLRDEIKQETEIGKRVQDIMKGGGFVDDETVLNLLDKKMKSKECEKGFILDGFPRNVMQAERLDELLEGLVSPFKLVAIDIATSDEEVMNRITNRYFCVKCKTNYNKLYKNPKVEEVCDVCGGTKFAVREDDKPEVVKNRLVEYNKQTAPVISYYKDEGVLSSVDGDKDIAKVSKAIDDLLKG